jgi:KUP system potassium uptake protein
MGKSRLVFKRLKVGPTSWAIMPRALMQFVKNNHVLHQCVVLATLLIEESPHIPHEERADITEVILSIDLRNITYWIGRATIVPREDIPGMRVWPESIFAFLQRNAER